MSESIEENREKNDLSSLLINILSKPETLSKMGQIIANLNESQSSDNSPPKSENKGNNQPSEEKEREYLDENNGTAPTFNQNDSNDILSKLPEMLSKLSSQNQENLFANKQQIALLLAIRPYLSEHRKELIDTFIKMNRLGSIFNNLT